MKTLFLVIFVTLSALLMPINADQVVYNAEFKNKVNGTVNFIFSPEFYEPMIVVIIDSGLEKGVEYPFHIHEKPVVNGDCDSTGGHLDPTGAGKDPNYKCDPKDPSKCEVGDLSGKYGGLKLNDDGEVIKKFFDGFITTNGTSGVDGRSVVIHLPDAAKTRYDCASIIFNNQS